MILRLVEFLSNTFNSRRKGRREQQLRRCRRGPLKLETLEDRTLLAVDIVLTDFSADGQDLRADYDVLNENASSMTIALYKSLDGTSLDALLTSQTITDPTDLSVGTGHSIIIPANFTDPQEDYRLIAVIDSGNVLAEDDETNNQLSFSGGVFVDSDNVIHVHGGGSADVVNVSVPTDLQVSLNGTDYTFDDTTVSAIHVRTHDGNDNLLASTSVTTAIWAFGGGGDDDFTSGAAADYLVGGEGSDGLYGEAGTDTIYGGGGGDDIRGGADEDTLYGDAGDDTVYGGTGGTGDTIHGGPGNDLLFGDDDLGDGSGGDADTLYGNAGEDTLYGEDGDDTLYGNEDDDRLNGGWDNNTIDHATSNDAIVEATAVTLNANQTVVFDSSTMGNGEFGDLDIDLYEVTLQNEQMLRATVYERNSSAFQGVLRVFHNTGFEYTDSDITVTQSGNTTTLEFIVDGSAIVGGTYYLGVSGFGNDMYDPTQDGNNDLSRMAGNIGDYLLTLENIEQDLPSEWTGASSIWQVTPFAQGDTVVIDDQTIGDGWFGDKDVDLYKVNLNNDETLRASISPRHSSGLLPTIRLFDSGGTEVDSGSIALTQNGDTTTLEFVVDGTTYSTGAYFVGISGSGNDSYDAVADSASDVQRYSGSTGDYSLSLVNVAPLTPDAPRDSTNHSNQWQVSLTVGQSQTIATETLGDGLFGDKDVDLYEVAVLAGEMLRVSVDSRNASGLQGGLRLFDSTGTEVNSNSITVTQSGDKTTLEFVVDGETYIAGDYYVGVAGPGNTSYDPTLDGDNDPQRSPGATGDYTLTIENVAKDAPTDSINQTNLWKVTPFAIGDTVTINDQTIGDGWFAAKDVELFEVNLNDYEKLRATIEPRNSSGLQPTIRLFNSGGFAISGGDITVTQSGDSTTLEFFLDGSTYSTDFYYVGISGLGNDLYDPALSGDADAQRSSGSTGDYTLTLSNAVEVPGDTLADAFPVTIAVGQNQVFNHEIGDSPDTDLDVDIYRLELLADQIVDVSVSDGGSGFQGFLRLFDSNGTELDSADWTNPTINLATTTAGSYYFGVSGQDNTIYDPQAAASGASSYTGAYQINFALDDTVNDPPVVDTPIANQATDEDAASSVIELANVFSDPDQGDVLIPLAEIQDHSLPQLLLLATVGVRLNIFTSRQHPWHPAFWDSPCSTLATQWTFSTGC